MARAAPFSSGEITSGPVNPFSPEDMKADGFDLLSSVSLPKHKIKDTTQMIIYTDV